MLITKYCIILTSSGQWWSDDQAVLKVDRPVALNEDIKAVCLADQGSVFPTGTQASLYSWGHIGTPGKHETPKMAPWGPECEMNL